MWSASCIYCHKVIKDGEPCYPVYIGGNKEYRHIHCYQETDEENVPFGEVLDLKGELD